MTEKQRFETGTVFKTRGKAPRTCTVVDVLKTYNSSGKLVCIRYVATYEFCGQRMASEFTDTTIAMGLPEQYWLCTCGNRFTGDECDACAKSPYSQDDHIPGPM